MSKFDLGLSNPYLKLGGALFLVGMALFTGSFVLGLKASGVVTHAGQVLLGTGLVVYVIGRLAKAFGSSAR